MLDAIRFLEQAGREPMSASGYAAAVAELDVDDLQRQALRNGDHAGLANLLGARPAMFFGVFAPEEEPIEEEPFEDAPEDPIEPEIKL
jgi:hypothetical protein